MFLNSKLNCLFPAVFRIWYKNMFSSVSILIILFSILEVGKQICTLTLSLYGFDDEKRSIK